jgi:hypothetical protein
MDEDGEKMDDLESRVERAAYALERFNTSMYEWDDATFDIWFNKDPSFTTRIENWGNFRGTRKEKLFHEVRLVLEAAGVI